MNDSHLPHLADQVDAANMEQSRLFSSLAAVAGVAPSADLPPFAKNLCSLLADRLMIGTTGLCPHLSTAQPAFWSPWFPGLVRCGPCFFRMARRSLNGSGNHTCDLCGRHAYRGVLRMGSVGVPGAAWDVEGVGPESWPPVTVTFGLCLGCSDEQGLA